MVDLSKAKAGDRVKFRCGGEAVIERGSLKSGFWFTGCPNHTHAIFYDDDGKYTGQWTTQGLIDIIEIIPKPFDWKEVRPGMAFQYRVNNDVVIYACKPVKEERGMGVYYDTTENRYWTFYENDLTRAPEHDVEVKQ